MVPIAQNPQARAIAQADIFTHLMDFVALHRGHSMAFHRPADKNEPFRVVCKTCQETMTLLFVYETNDSS